MSVILYTGTNCPWCVKAKEFLDENKIKYEERDVSEEKYKTELIDKSGQMGIPVIDFNGEIIVGFDVEALEKAQKTTKPKKASRLNCDLTKDCPACNGTGKIPKRTDNERKIIMTD